MRSGPGVSEDPDAHLRTTFRWLRWIWVTLGIAASAFLISAGGGHPPPFIFIPIVAAGWFAGHLALIAARRLGVRGATTSDRARWPLSLVVALIASGGVSFLGIGPLVVSAMQRRPYPFYGSLWLLVMAIWAVHVVCLAGLLLRRGWARGLAALLSLGWAALLAWQIIDHLWYRRPIDWVELPVAIGIVGALVVFAILLLRSQRAKEFLGP